MMHLVVGQNDGKLGHADAAKIDVEKVGWQECVLIPSGFACAEREIRMFRDRQELCGLRAPAPLC